MYRFTCNKFDVIILLGEYMKTQITEYGAYSGKHLCIFLLKNIIKSLIKGICRPFVYLNYILKYNNIWNLKSHLLNKKIKKGLMLSYYLKYLEKKGAYIGLESELKDIPCFPHGLSGIFISGKSKIGANCVIFHQVTIGSNTLIDSKNIGGPTIGDNVYIGAGAKIIGNVKIGNNCRIGANAVVVNDMEENTVAVNQPTRFIKRKKLDNRFIVIGETGNFYYKDGGYIKMYGANEI